MRPLYRVDYIDNSHIHARITMRLKGSYSKLPFVALVFAAAVFTYELLYSKTITETVLLQKHVEGRGYKTVFNTKHEQDLKVHYDTTEKVAKEQSAELVILSAYFKLEKFHKGLNNNFFDTSLYMKWSEVFAYMHNPFVFYTDSLEFKNHVETLRKNLTAITKVIFVSNRTELWSFQMNDAIGKIFEDPSYPKHHPNTVIANYSCVQHAKYELLERTIKMELFKEDYYAWLDVGYFREMADAKTRLPFQLRKPPKLNNSRIAYNLIQKRNMDAKPKAIFRHNIYWVGGGFFCGRKDTMVSFVQQYHRATLFYLQQKLMNSDQQIIYSMYTSLGRKEINPKVELQLYSPIGYTNRWFYLGYLCLKKYTPADMNLTSTTVMTKALSTQ